MKKLVLTGCAGLICFLISCNDTAKVASEHAEASQAEKNMQADEAVSNAFKTGDMKVLDSVIADDFVDHTERGDKKGRDSLKSMIAYVRSNFEGMKMDVISRAANDNYVFTVMRFTGNNPVAMEGMPAGPYDMKALEVTRCEGGKAVEHWEYMDMQDVMKRMGDQKAMTDSVKVKK
jgi:predicted SnoaL-like aldol condensation-catalyzing enzyme